MSYSFNLTFICLFLFTLMTLISRQRYILPMLICLESLMLYLIIFIMLALSNQLMEFSLFMVMMLVMNVSSASIGLTILVTMSRKEGNDSSMLQLTNSC